MRDFNDNDWLFLIEDDGPSGLGRVLGYVVCDSEHDTVHTSLGAACDACGLFIGEEIPRDVVQAEIMTYGDFRASYGNRMPLQNRGKDNA